MTPEQREARRLYMAEYRTREGRLARERELDRLRRAAWTPEKKAAKHELRRLYTQRIREAGIHTASLLSREEFEALYLEQHGVCAICHKPETKLSAKGRVRRLSIDHDHRTGRVRALLCSMCNTALGNLREDPEIAEAAAAYLRWHSMASGMAQLNETLGGEPPQIIRPLRRHRVASLSVEAARLMQEALG